MLDSFELDDFPSLKDAAEQLDQDRKLRYREHFANAIADFKNGIADGEIRNVNYVNAKSTIAMLIGKAWDHPRRKQYDDETRLWSKPVIDAMGYVYMSSLSDVRSADNKLSKAESKGFYAPTLRSTINEFMPLVVAAEHLKDKVVKGRAPNKAASKPENPNKDVKTCSCCFRSIAVRNGKMVHHGFERPGYGYQTASCWGVNFPPLEISLEGLEWLIQNRKDALESNKKKLQELPERETIFLFHNQKPQKFVRGDSNFTWALNKATEETKTDIKLLNWELDNLGQHLEKWTEYHSKLDEENHAPKF
jgi:hypothetical protein